MYFQGVFYSIFSTYGQYNGMIKKRVGMMMKKIKKLLLGDIEKDFFEKNRKQIDQRNIKMLKVAYSFAIFINVSLFIYAYLDDFLKELGLFYGFFSNWMIIWTILLLIMIDKHPNYSKIFYFILATTALIITAVAGTYYSANMCAVMFMVFLIFIPGLYIGRPYLCLTYIIPSGILFISLVFVFKTDPQIIMIDIVNTIFSMIVSAFYSFYSIHVQLENIKASRVLSVQSTTDELTHLPNRRSFNKKIDTYFSKNEVENISIIMIDIDYFKTFNDTYGHLKGDECLSLIGEGLRRVAMKHQVFISRFGGEEFAAIVVGDKDVEIIANDFVHTVAKLNIFNEKTPLERVTISAGYANYKMSKSKTYMELINEADEALYQAKSLGRNRVQAFMHK